MTKRYPSIPKTPGNVLSRSSESCVIRRNFLQRFSADFERIEAKKFLRMTFKTTIF